jgi:hypothetical protein
MLSKLKFRVVLENNIMMIIRKVDLLLEVQMMMIAIVAAYMTKISATKEKKILS